MSATELRPAWVHTPTAAGEGTPPCLGESGTPRKASDWSGSAITAEASDVGEHSWNWGEEVTRKPTELQRPLEPFHYSWFPLECLGKPWALCHCSLCPGAEEWESYCHVWTSDLDCKTVPGAVSLAWKCENNLCFQRVCLMQRGALRFLALLFCRCFTAHTSCPSTSWTTSQWV